MRCAFAVLQLCLVLSCAAITITNEEFDVQPGVDFEVTWEDAGGNRVDIDLHESPIWAHVEALSRGKVEYVKTFSRWVLISEDIEPRMYCFKVTDWPSGQTDYSDAFFFNGTGLASTSVSPSAEATSTATVSSTANAPPGDNTNPPGSDDGASNGNSNAYIRRSYQLSPLMIVLVSMGGFVFVAGIASCAYCSFKSRKKKRLAAAAAAAAEAEGANGDETAAGAMQNDTAGQQIEARVEGTVSEKQTGEAQVGEVREYYAPHAMLR